MKLLGIAGQNLYRVTYTIPPTRGMFQKLIVASNITEVEQILKGVKSVELIEEDISMLVPKIYAGEASGG